MDWHEFGQTFLGLGPRFLDGAIGLAGCVIVLALAGVYFKERRLVLGSRMAVYGLFLSTLAASAALVSGFVTGQYNNEYVYNYSESQLHWPFKLAGLWAGLNGSILFWSLIQTAFAAAVAVQHHWSGRHPIGRRLEPWVYAVLGSIAIFFLLVTRVVTNPFATMDLKLRLHQAQVLGIQLDAAGNLNDGHGLNPQLENYWMAIHPPSLYTGFVGFSVPFAFAIASLMAREMGDYWIKITRRWTLFAWLFLTNGIILGGLWAYEMLGWGGYWAWDPVENASFLPWLTGTAFLHSVMIQERRDMLKAWNVFLIILTFFMTIVATYMTRSGVVASVHAFSDSAGTITTCFHWFMGSTAGLSLFLLFYRIRDLRGKHQLESIFSREAAFYFNNLALVALAVAVYFLSMFPKISHDFLARSLSVQAPMFNRVTTPLFALLVFLTAIGPQIGWVKATPENLQRNFLVPASMGAIAIGGLYGFWAFWKMIPDLQKAVFPFFYPTALLIGLAVFVLGTIYTEFHRGIKSRVNFRGESLLQGVMSLFILNNRRYGGYVVHLGFSLCVIGIVISSFFRHHEDLTLEPGVIGKIGERGEYTVEVAPFDAQKDAALMQADRPYQTERARFTIRNQAGTVLSSMSAERHLYPKLQQMGQGGGIGIPAIDRHAINDYYLFYHERDSNGAVKFEVFVNPCVNWIWAGWILMILGGIVAILPMPQRRLGLAE